MISSRKDSKGPRSTFLPHQSKFIEMAMTPASSRMILLRADAGLGKLATLVQLVNQLFTKRPNAQVLIVVDPNVLRLEFEYRLREKNIRTLLFDVYRLREMLDSTKGKIRWPSGLGVILSLDFAEQPDIMDSLAETKWDLVIGFEPNLHIGAGAKTFSKIVGSAKRVVLATGLTPALPPAFLKQFALEVSWRRNQIVGRDGKQLETVPPVLHEIPFTLTVDELALREAVRDLSESLEASYFAQDLANRLESSPAALEDALQIYLRDATTPEGQQDLGLLPLQETESNKQERALELNQARFESAAAAADKILEKIGSSDSKLDAFDKLLEHLSGSNIQHKQICVCTQFVDTLYYVSVEIEGRGMTCQLLHSEMGITNRHHSAKMYSEGQKILVAATDSMVGIDLQDVTDLILYDAPDERAELRNLLSKFDRFGKRNQLHIYIFTPSNPDSFIAGFRMLVRDALADQVAAAADLRQMTL